MRNTCYSIILFCLFAPGCKKEELPDATPEPPVTKNVLFTVYSGTDYTDSYYQDARGQVELSIAKISENGVVTQVLWDTVFTWRQLALYPSFQNKVSIQKEFSIFDGSEKLQVSFIRKYNLNGGFSQVATGAPALEGNVSLQYDVEM